MLYIIDVYHLIVPFNQSPARPDKVSYCHMVIHLMHLWPHIIAVLFMLYTIDFYHLTVALNLKFTCFRGM